MEFLAHALSGQEIRHCLLNREIRVKIINLHKYNELATVLFNQIILTKNNN